MTRKSAWFFSVILHPILMPLIGLSIILFTGSFISFIPVQTKKIIFLIFTTGTFLLPLLMMLLFWFRGIISDVQVMERTERVIPYAMTFIFYLFTKFLLLRVPVYHFLHSYMLGCLICLLLILLLNIKWKISSHMAGLGGLTALIMVISIKLQVNLMALLIITILASGIVATSRLILKAHTPVEVYSGFILGFSTFVIVMLFFG